MAQERKGGRPSKEAGAKLEQVSQGKTRNLAAAGTGYSGSSLDKVDKIRDAAERGLLLWEIVTKQYVQTNPVTIRSHCRQHGPFHAGTGWDVNPVNTG